MTTASAPIASRVSAVSLRLSPLDTLEPLAEKLMTSADSRLAASLERDAGAGGVLEEQVDHRAPRRVGSFLTVGAVGDRGQLLGGVEHAGRVVAVEVGGREQVALHAPPPPARCRRLVVLAVVSARRTRTDSRSEVGRFLPT
jgi:hypothetical protein